MTVDEAKSAIQELKAQGLNDEGIAASLYQMYTEDKIDLEQFGSLVKLVGYDLSDEFMALSDEEKKNQDIGEFGMSEDEDEESNESSSSENDGAEDEEPKEDEQKEEEEENPYETPEKKSSDENDEEYKKVYGD